MTALPCRESIAFWNAAIPVSAALVSTYAGKPLDVLYASNGEEALVQVEQRPTIDLIVLDVNMPVMDGPAFLERLRRDYASLEIPVMVSSTRAYAMRDQLGNSMGVVAYLQKPFSPRELHALLDKLWS